MLKRIRTILPFIIVSVAVTSCSSNRPPVSLVNTQAVTQKSPEIEIEQTQTPIVFEKRSPKKQVAKKPIKQRITRNNKLSNSFNSKLSNAALGRLNSNVKYDGSYVKIAFPGGDVSPNIGVCTDVVIRSYRKLGIDLQEQVHRDMTAAFNTYPNPKQWGLSKPDSNIDHRRVYNLRKFFERRGAALPITADARNYKPGDIVSWMVGPNLPHIGVVVDKRSKADPNRFMIVHNIARGPEIEDILFAFPITGHFRYTPKHMKNIPTGIYTQQQPSRNRNLSYDQLVQAAKLLGTTDADNDIQANQIAKPVENKRLNNQAILNQIVDLNKTGKPLLKAKNESLVLANLSNDAIETLLLNKKTNN